MQAIEEDKLKRKFLASQSDFISERCLDDNESVSETVSKASA